MRQDAVSETLKKVPVGVDICVQGMTTRSASFHVNVVDIPGGPVAIQPRPTSAEEPLFRWCNFSTCRQIIALSSTSLS